MERAEWGGGGGGGGWHGGGQGKARSTLEGTAGRAGATMSVPLRLGARRDGEAAEERQQPRGR